MRYIDALILRDRDTDTNEPGPDERLYALRDANFNVTALAEATGAGVERFAYDAGPMVRLLVLLVCWHWACRD